MHSELSKISINGWDCDSQLFGDRVAIRYSLQMSSYMPHFSLGSTQSSSFFQFKVFCMSDRSEQELAASLVFLRLGGVFFCC